MLKNSFYCAIIELSENLSKRRDANANLGFYAENRGFVADCFGGLLLGMFV